MDPNLSKHEAAASPFATIERVARFSYFQPGTRSDLSENASREYSRMKYGDPDATHSIAARLTDLLLHSPDFLNRIPEDRRLVLASSAYGSIPNAARALAREVMALLELEGYRVELVKIHREGGFSRTNYGALGFDERLGVLRRRRLSISPEDRAVLENSTLLVVDDMRSTGAHEQVLADLVLGQTQVQSLVFAYWISFEDELQTLHPMQEESINHSNITSLEDLLPFFADPQTPPYLNARVLKFMLLGGLQADASGSADQLEFFRALPLETCQRIYRAALSRDGYHAKKKFIPGIRMLERRLMETESSDKTTLFNIVSDAKGRLIDLESGEELGDVMARYSRFKFGGIEEIRWFGKALADQMLSEIAAGGPLATIFAQAKEKGEYIYLQAPGYRNVVSASNFLLREVARRVNVWLSLHGLPTMIVKPLTRLASGRANYAQLSAQQRESRPKTTQSLIPKSDYRDQPIHVIFLDDVEVTGSTADRARKLCREAGALSFHAVFAFRVLPALAQTRADIEHEMNQFRVQGRLDDTVASILSHPDYKPVQRMLRLILHPDNRAQLQDFARQQVPNRALLRVYEAAMANDYLWINPQGGDAETAQHGEYGPSLLLLRELMEEEGLLDADGLPIPQGYA